MARFSGNALNMDGSDDPFYRYKMPAMQVKVEGSTKMVKTVLLNLDDVCRAIGRPCDHLLVYLGQQFNAATQSAKRTGKAYISGSREQAEVQDQVFKFLQDAVLCSRCGKPETSFMVEGSKKKKVGFLSCKGCAARTNLDSTDRFVKYMILHPPENAAFGHADAPTATSPTEQVLADADTAQFAREKKHKSQCGQCGHRSSKACCSKCGAAIDTAAAAASSLLPPTQEGRSSSVQSVLATAPPGDGHAKAKQECRMCGHRTSKASCSQCGATMARNGDGEA